MQIIFFLHKKNNFIFFLILVFCTCYLVIKIFSKTLCSEIRSINNSDMNINMNNKYYKMTILVKYYSLIFR